VIELDGVTVRYAGADESALRDVDLRIATGETVALVGASGSGKTTLLRLLDALLLPSEGTVRVDGMDTSDPQNLWEVRRRVGLIFQNPDNQIVSTTVERELAFGMENLGVPPVEIARRVEEAVARFRLGDLRDREPHRLSGGEKQRVAIAAVLSMEPSCVALDEPTSLLDASGRSEVWQTLAGLSAERDRTVVHVTQFPDEILLAGRAVVLDRGAIVFDGTPESLFARGDDLARWGLEPPAAARLAGVLRDGGLRIPDGIASLDALADAVVATGDGGPA